MGQRVRARNMHSVGHTRLPRYVRAKLGTIERTTVSLSSLTPMPISSARSRNTYTQCASPCASCGATEALPFPADVIVLGKLCTWLRLVDFTGPLDPEFFDGFNGHR